MLQIVDRRSERTKLQRALVRTLKDELPPVGIRTIGFPSGHRPMQVFSRGEGRLWAAFSKNEDSPTLLPASLWESLDDGFLRVDLAGPALPRWVAPAAAADGATGVKVFPRLVA